MRLLLTFVIIKLSAPRVNKTYRTENPLAPTKSTIAYAEALTLWQHDEQFRTFFLAQLAASPFAAFRWETPPITTATTDRPFEFVLHNAPGLIGSPDRQAFASHFTHDASNEGVVAFENLGGDAILVVPSPRGPDAAYGHLAAFVRNAPARQQHCFWRTVGQTALTCGSLTLGHLAVYASGFTAGVLWARGVQGIPISPFVNIDPKCFVVSQPPQQIHADS